MGMDVWIKSGEQPRYFTWAGVASTTGTSGSTPIYKESPFSTFQAITTAAATVVIEVTNEQATAQGTNNNWITLGTITLAGGGTDGFATTAPSPWKWARARPSSNAGSVQVIMGV